MKSHQLNQISAHIYWLSPDSATDRPILGAISGTHSTLIVDAGNSAAHATMLLGQLAGVGVPKPAFLALTHWHWDHVFGAATLDVPAFAHVETRRIVAEMANLDWSDQALDQRVSAGLEIPFCRDMIKAELPDRSDLVIRPPNIAFTEQVEIDLGAVTAQIMHAGGDHGSDASIVYVPQEKVMFLGDCLSPDLYAGEPSYTSAEFFQLVGRLLSFEVDYYLEGHNPEPLSRADLLALARDFELIAGVVDKVGPDRKTIIAALQKHLGRPLEEESIQIADAFLAGLKKPAQKGTNFSRLSS
jgi:glyoxylase-like metal-dependent hydrolase (beta-lactamase superfamily II)